MKEDILIIHNPRCSKSRATLEILQAQGVEPKVIDYLNGELSETLLKAAFQALGKSPRDVLRTHEDEFKSLNLDLANDEQVIKAILKHPKILERPIVMKGNKAVIGRPPENVLELFA